MNNPFTAEEQETLRKNFAIHSKNYAKLLSTAGVHEYEMDLGDGVKITVRCNAAREHEAVLRIDDVLTLKSGRFNSMLLAVSDVIRKGNELFEKLTKATFNFKK